MTNHITLRVLSFNMLWNMTNFEGRFNTVVTELKIVKPDVIMLQEVHDDALDIITTGLDQMGYKHSNAGDGILVDADAGKHYRNVTFSRFPIKESSQIAFPLIRTQQNLIPVPVTVIEFEGKDWHFLNVHLCWGGWEEATRLQQVQNLTRYAATVKSKEPDSVIILGGDFNAEENHDSIRSLRGETSIVNQTNTGGVPLALDVWTDAWKTCGAKEDLRVTSNPESYWGKNTGKKHGILIPRAVPKRRIDYLFSYGWVYGKISSPVNFGLFCDKIIDTPFSASDHFGVWADFLAVFDSN